MKNTIRIFGFLTTFILPLPTFGDPIHVQVDYSEPWGYYQQSVVNDSPERQLKGIWIEIIRLFTDHTGIKFQTTIAPHARVLQNLKHGKIDMSFQVRPEKDSENIIYITEMFAVQSIAVSIKSNPVFSYDDLFGKRIGIVRGKKISQKFDNDRSLFKQSFRNYSIIISMLFQKRLDVVVGDHVSIQYLMKRNNFSDNYSSTFILRKSSIWLQLSVFSLSKDKMRNLIAANALFKQRGDYKKIIESFVGYQM
ncbi:MAG: transporter substrate-binding domain-containing protein [Proteobacteria bacterium]|nr:transporter substrate-binding domain-containing protein [Pseudomonadota bacterium]